MSVARVEGRAAKTRQSPVSSETASSLHVVPEDRAAKTIQPSVSKAEASPLHVVEPTAGSIVRSSPSPTPIPPSADYYSINKAARKLKNAELVWGKLNNQWKAIGRDPWMPQTLTVGDDWEWDVLAVLPDVLRQLKKCENLHIRELTQLMRASPWVGWIDAHPGIGEKGLGKVLSSIGDPSWHSVHDRPRTLYELNALCGLHVVRPDQVDLESYPAGVGAAFSGGDTSQCPRDSRHGRAGVAPRKRAENKDGRWNHRVRSILWTMADSAIRNGSEGSYQSVYGAAKEHYADSVHHGQCVGKWIVLRTGERRLSFCKTGADGGRAQAGDMLGAGHQHARALRKVMKTILEDVWVEARRLRGLTGDA